MSEEGLPEQVRIRRQTVERMRGAGQDPYPVSVPRDITVAMLLEQFAGLGPDERSGRTVSVAGRVVSKRDSSQFRFADLRDGSTFDTVQLVLRVEGRSPQQLESWRLDLDIGDHISATGEVITTRRGQLSLDVASWVMAGKALRPLPDRRKGLDAEARVRQRYVDLIVTEQARELVRAKSTVLASLRSTLARHDFIEVETPVLQPLHGGAAARPFVTHMNAFDLPMYLRIALELYLKRLIVGDVERVYEIGRTFRNEGLDTTHANDFSMLEAYEAYGDYNTMAELTRELVLDAARALGTTVITARDGREVDLEQPWRQASIHELVSDAVDQPLTPDTPADELRRLADQRDVVLQDRWSAGEILLELYEKLVEHTLIEPTFVRDYPAQVRPLARPHRDDPRLTEAWDLVVNGVELAPAYSELIDPDEQRRRLTEQSLLAAGGDPEAMQLDEDFLRALEYGAPPIGGMGMGVDRLLMTLTGANIRETVTFPLVRPV